MAKTATITLDDVAYTIQAFDLEQVEQIGSLLREIRDDPENKSMSAMLKVLKMALSTDPNCKEPGKVRGSMSEIRIATEAVLKLAGLEAANPQEAAAPAAT